MIVTRNFEVVVLGSDTNTRLCIDYDNEIEVSQGSHNKLWFRPEEIDEVCEALRLVKAELEQQKEKVKR